MIKEINKYAQIYLDAVSIIFQRPSMVVMQDLIQHYDSDDLVSIAITIAAEAIAIIIITSTTTA